MPKKTIFRTYYEKIPKQLRNKYVLTVAVFLVWMLFFDRHDFFTQRHLQNTLNDMEAKTEHFKEKVKEVEKENEDLTTNQETMERFAREKYLMKRDDEEVFVIERKEN